MPLAPTERTGSKIEVGVDDIVMWSGSGRQEEEKINNQVP